jgi:hypothetical protein
LMQAAKPVAESARDAMLKDIAAELGQHEVVGPGLLHRIISEVSGAMMSLTNAVLRHKNGKTRGCEGVGHGGLLPDSSGQGRGDKRRTVQ